MATWQHLRSSTANKRPTTSLADGRIAINTNTASPGLFFKDSAGTGIVKVGPVHVGTTAPNSVPAAGGSSGNYLGEQWLDTSVSPAQMKVWNGSTWVGIVADELPVSKLQDGAARQLIQTDAAGTGVEWTSDVDVPGTLDVTSTATFDSIAQHPLGTAGAPTITFTGDNNTGIYSPGADQVAISTNGTKRLQVDAGGNVSIDAVTNTGTKPLSIYSQARDCEIRLTTNSGTANDAYVTLRQSGGNLDLYSTNGAITLNPANTERLRITSAGLVGVGTSSVSALFHVAGDSSDGTQARITGATNQNYQLRWGFDTTNLAGRIQSIHVGTAYRPLLLNPDGGSVGIGTTSPGYNLDIQGSQGVGLQIYENSSGNNRRLRITQESAGVTYDATFSTANNTHRWLLGGSEAARLDANGRLLVGTSSARANYFNSTATTQLQIEKAGGGGGVSVISASVGDDPAVLILGKSNNASVGGNTVVAVDNFLGTVSFQGNDGSEFVDAARISCYVDGTPGANDMPGRLVFSTTADGASSPTERMRINKDGEILFGTSTTTNGCKLALVNTDATRKWGFGTIGTNTYFAVVDDTSGAGVQLNAGSTSWSTFSDERLKDNLAPIQDGLDKVSQLRAVTGRYKTDDIDMSRSFLIAQDVQAVLPEAVDVMSDDMGTLSLKYTEVIPLLVSALKESKERIETLEAKVAALESA